MRAILVAVDRATSAEGAAEGSQGRARSAPPLGLARQIPSPEKGDRAFDHQTYRSS